MKRAKQDVHDDNFCFEGNKIFLAGGRKNGSFFRPCRWSQQVVAIGGPLTVRPPTFATGFGDHFWGRKSAPLSEAPTKVGELSSYGAHCVHVLVCI